MDKKTLFWDKFGIFGATFCAIHCLLSGVIVAMAPSLSIIFKNELFHLALLIGTMPVAFFAVYSGRKEHGENLPLFIVSVAIIFLLSGYLIEEGVFKMDALNPEYVTLLGSVGIIAAHAINMYKVFNKKKACC